MSKTAGAKKNKSKYVLVSHTGKTPRARSRYRDAVAREQALEISKHASDSGYLYQNLMNKLFGNPNR